MNIIVGIGQGKKVIGGVKIVNRDRVTIIGENIEITPINPGIAKATTAILIIIKQEGAEVDQIKGIINQCLMRLPLFIHRRHQLNLFAAPDSNIETTPPIGMAGRPNLIDPQQKAITIAIHAQIHQREGLGINHQ